MREFNILVTMNTKCVVTLYSGSEVPNFRGNLLPPTWPHMPLVGIYSENTCVLISTVRLV
jgi:hypothetical protein